MCKARGGANLHAQDRRYSMNRPTQVTRPSETLKACVLPATLLASVLAFTACGGGSGGGADTTQPPPSPVALQASPPGALLGYIQGKLSTQVDKGQDFLSYNGFYRGGQIVDFATATTTS